MRPRLVSTVVDITLNCSIRIRMSVSDDVYRARKQEGHERNEPRGVKVNGDLQNVLSKTRMKSGIRRWARLPMIWNL